MEVHFYEWFIARGVHQNMAKIFVLFLKDKTAATAIEYGLIAAGIAIAIITVT
jgi:hypothetical protein